MDGTNRGPSADRGLGLFSSANNPIFKYTIALKS